MTMGLRDLLEKRAARVRAMRELTDNPAGEGGDLSDQQVADFDKHKRELEATEAQISRQQTVDDAERRMAAPAIIHGNGRDGDYEARARGFSLVKAILHRLGEDVDIGFEKEISTEVRRRSGRSFAGIAVPDQYFLERRVIDITPGASPDAVAGPLYPTTLRPDLFVDRLRSALTVQRLGATTLSGLTGTIDIPRQVSSSTAQHVAEDGALTRTDPSFDDVTLSPKTVGAVTSYTRRTLLNALPSIEGIVRNDLAATVAAAIDFQALFGDGTGNAPTGVRNVTGVHDLSLAGPTWPEVLAFPTAIQADDADVGSMAWVMSPTAVSKLRATLKTTADTSSNFMMTEPGSLAGYPVATTTAVPAPGSPQAATVLFGAWSQLLLAFWSGLDVLVNPYSEEDYVRGRVSVRVMRDYDVAVRHAESFAFGEDLNAG
jgi:HK97 family phage major capsid protein